MAADVGTGATLTLGTSAWSGQITSISHSGISRPAVDITHLGSSAARQFKATDLYDPGTLEIEVLFEPSSDAVPYAVASSIANEVVTITFPKPAESYATAATMVSAGHVEEFSYGVPLEDLMTGSFTIKLSCTIAWASATT